MLIHSSGEKKREQSWGFLTVIFVKCLYKAEPKPREENGGRAQQGTAAGNVAQCGEKYLNETSAENQGPALGLRNSKENKDNIYT